MKVKSDFQAISELVNIARIENQGKILSVNELKRILGGIIPVNDLARTWLVKAEVINRVGRGKYMFPKDPVNWICVKKFYTLSRERKERRGKSPKREFVVTNGQNLSAGLKPEVEVKTKPEVKSAQTFEPEYNEEKAVAFLKNRGYIILKMM